MPLTQFNVITKSSKTIKWTGYCKDYGIDWIEAFKMAPPRQRHSTLADEVRWATFHMNCAGMMRFRVVIFHRLFTVRRDHRWHLSCVIFSLNHRNESRSKLPICFSLLVQSPDSFLPQLRETFSFPHESESVECGNHLLLSLSSSLICDCYGFRPSHSICQTDSLFLLELSHFRWSKSIECSVGWWVQQNSNILHSHVGWYYNNSISDRRSSLSNGSRGEREGIDEWNTE